VLSIKELACIYGPKLLFTDVNLTLNPGNRFGIVGGNGAGKSTFLKLLAGEEEPSMGEVVTAHNSRIGWLKQDQFRYENTSILNTVIAGNSELWGAICEKEELLEKGVFDDEVGYRLGELEDIIMRNDGYNADYTASELLRGLGIKEEYHSQPLSVLSGGYKLRVLLAQSLFDNPDILLLDEPTNHLDIISIYWLENYLKTTFKGVLLFISHDVHFINNLATHILDIDYGEITCYTGNYNKFVVQKKETMERKQRELAAIEAKMDHMRVFIEKFRSSSSRSKQSLSREKMLDKIELPDIKRSSRVSPNFKFKQKRPSGRFTLKVENISKSYEDRKVLNNVNFSITRGEKVIIIGPNGIGKSTLLKILMDRLAADDGKHEWGHETTLSYFAQDHHESLNKKISAYEWMCEQLTEEPTNNLRAILGRMLFKQDEQHKSVLNLSGGEGARLLLAKIMVEENNCMILDEPTNHLDIETKEALQNALIDYPGTLIMVTHDRDFAANIATRIIAITEKKVTDHRGTYEEYLDKHGKDYFS
jgi:ATPase subunit of ABC transporter with duplicated ATPase domains